MVTNIPEEAKTQWKRASEAKSPEKKILELQSFISLVPKHKGTENLLMQAKRKIANLKEDIEQQKNSRKTSSYLSAWDKPRHASGRIVITGYSEILMIHIYETLTKKPGLLTTIFEPIYGILESQHIQFQVVVLPVFKGGKIDIKIIDFLKGSDLILFAHDNNENYVLFTNFCSDHGLDINPKKGTVDIKRTVGGGIRVVGNMKKYTVENVRKTVLSYGIRDAIIKIEGDMTLDDIENSILETKIYRPIYKVKIQAHLQIYDPINKKTSNIKTLHEFVEIILNKLNMIRIYTKNPGGETSPRPYLLNSEAKVGDLAKQIHSWFRSNFKYAVIWRKNNPNPIRVSKNFKLEDQDRIEIRAHTR